MVQGHPPDDNITLVWFYCTGQSIVKKMQCLYHSVAKVAVHDVRYKDQLFEFSREIQCLCTRISVSMAHCEESIQQIGEYTYGSPYTLSFCSPIRLHGVLVSGNARSSMEMDADKVLSGLFENILARYYYVFKLQRQGRLHMPFFLWYHRVPMRPLGDLRSWDAICEDGDMTLLSHPALPHPSDFLLKKERQSDSSSYLERCRFEYQFPGTLQRYSVVLGRKRSPIPKLCVSSYTEEPPPVPQKPCVAVAATGGQLDCTFAEPALRKKKRRNRKTKDQRKIAKETMKKTKRKLHVRAMEYEHDHDEDDQEATAELVVIRRENDNDDDIEYYAWHSSYL